MTSPLNPSRRGFISTAGIGFGGIALSSILNDESVAAPHFAPKAKHVIYLHMIGAPSHLDLYDEKPELKKRHNEPCPPEVTKGRDFAFIGKTSTLAGSPWKFRKHGESGQVLSELLPNLGEVADELAIMRSIHSEEINHAPAQMFLHSGFGRGGRPSFGSWVTYGLGSENKDLPGYVVLLSGPAGGAGTSMWSSGFLPSIYQGIQFRSQGDPVLFLSSPAGQSRKDRRGVLDALAELNQEQLEATGDPEIETRIRQYEMAYRMQASVPELMDLSKEGKETFDLYGEEARTPGTFAACCLNARRLAERGVRNIQIFHRGWDAHGGLPREHESQCKDVDRGCAALIKDLKRNGMLDDTLVIWGGEFGRTSYCQGKLTKENYGRDHHPRCFTTWMAGGGIKPGITYGHTDDYGYNIANPDGSPMTPQPSKEKWTPGTMHIHDLNATILHLLGIDHKRLTFRYQGRDFRLTDVHGHVIHDLIA